jgi:predicted dehydrogenase
MTKDRYSRREFLGVGAAAAGASLVGSPIFPIPAPSAQAAPTRRVPPSDRVRFGIVGVGMQGSSLLTESIRLDGVECAAACDLYDGRHALAREIAGAALPVTRRYQQLLEDKEIDCIIAAVPDHWHRKLVVDALSAGKDVYCEKPMSHTPAEGVAMVQAAKKTGRIVQVGSQRVSSRICARAREMITGGVLGDMMLIEAWWGRNDPTGAWQYPPPPDLSPRTLDWDTWQGDVPRRPFDPNIFARWRAYRDYGTGVAGDLLVHLISGMMFMADLNRAPTTATSIGGIRRWKDGRDMPDVHAALFQYGDLPVYMRLNLGTDMPETYRFQGSKGILEVTGTTITFTPQSGRDDYPSYYAYSFPQPLREEYFRKWHAENDARLRAATLPETVTIRGPEFNDLAPHLTNFFDAVRTRKPVVEDALFGHNAAMASHMANASYFRKSVVTAESV